MAEPRLSLACWDYDRTQAVLGGHVGIDGWRVDAEVRPPGELFPLAVGDAPYDVSELSLSSYVMQRARGAGAYVAVPAFVSRAFRHSGICVRADAGIDAPKDLEGRAVGVPEYQMTAALLMRGLLADDYGVDLASIRWRTAGLDAAGRKERLPLALPDSMDVAPAPEGANRNDLLLAGDLDALLAPAPPRAFRAGDARVRRLFADAATVERAYHARTGLFPPMHVIGVRASLAEAHPGLATAVHGAFLEARRIAMAALRAVAEASANKVMLPWFAAEYEATRAAMGDDFWPYGVAPNHADLETLVRYSHEQHLSPRRLAVEDLFHPETLDLPGV